MHAHRQEGQQRLDRVLLAHPQQEAPRCQPPVQARVLAREAALRSPAHLHQGDEVHQQARPGGHGQARGTRPGVPCLLRRLVRAQGVARGERRRAATEEQARAQGPEAGLRPQVERGADEEEGHERRGGDQEVRRALEHDRRVGT